jgi:fructokinase
MKVLFASLVVALLSVASVVESWSARHFKRCVASAVVSTGLLSGSTQIVLADTASELFAKATKAIQNNEGEYKAFDEEWKATKRTLADTDKLVGNTGAMLASVAQAGDAFTAAVTLGLLAGWPLSKLHAHAERVAAYVCTQPGGTPPIPADLRVG